MSIKGDSPSSTNASSSPKSTYSIQSDDKANLGSGNVDIRTDNSQQDSNNRRDIVVVTRVASEETLESQSSTSSMGIRPESSFNYEDASNQARVEMNNRVHGSNMNTINKYYPVRFPKNNERQLSDTNNLNEKVQGTHTVQSSTQEDKILAGDTSNSQVTPSLNIAEFPTDKLLKMLTALLTKIIKSNDRTAATNPSLTQEIENGRCLALSDNEKKYLSPVLGFRGSTYHKLVLTNISRGSRNIAPQRMMYFYRSSCTLIEYPRDAIVSLRPLKLILQNMNLPQMKAL